MPRASAVFAGILVHLFFNPSPNYHQILLNEHPGVCNISLTFFGANIFYPFRVNGYYERMRLDIFLTVQTWRAGVLISSWDPWPETLWLLEVVSLMCVCACVHLKQLCCDLYAIQFIHCKCAIQCLLDL